MNSFSSRPQSWMTANNKTTMGNGKVPPRQNLLWFLVFYSFGVGQLCEENELFIWHSFPHFVHRVVKNNIFRIRYPSNDSFSICHRIQLWQLNLKVYPSVISSSFASKSRFFLNIPPLPQTQSGHAFFSQSNEFVRPSGQWCFASVWQWLRSKPYNS